MGLFDSLLQVVRGDSGGSPTPATDPAADLVSAVQGAHREDGSLDPVRLSNALGSFADPDLAEMRQLRRRVDSLDEVQRFRRRTDSIENATTGLGTLNDKATRGVPVRRSRWSEDELEALYRWNTYAAMMVDKPADEAVRKGWRLVIDDDDPEEVTADQELEDKRLNLPSMIADGIRWGRLYGGAIGLMVTDEDRERAAGLSPGDPWGWLREPLDLGRVSKLHAIQLLACTSEARPLEWDTDIRSVQYGKPSMWQIQPGVKYGGATDLSSTDGGVPGSAQVHGSRVLWFRGTLLPRKVRNRNQGIDDSVIERAWDAIQNITSADQAMAVLVHELKIDVIKLAKLSAVATSDEGEAALHTRLRQIAQGKSLLNAIVIGDDEDYAQHHSPVTGFAELHDKAEGAYSAASGMAKTMVYGDAPSGLNTDGESHRDNWFRVVAAYQESYVRPLLEQAYAVVLAAKDGPTGGDLPEDWSLVFNPLDQPTTATKMTNLLGLAKAANEFVKMGVVGVEVASEMVVALASEMDVELSTEEGEDEAMVESTDTTDPAPADDDLASPTAAQVADLATKEGEGKAQDTALNGAQVEAAVGIVERAARGELTPAMANAMLRLFFNLTKPAADEILAGVETVQPTTTQPAATNDGP